jgi:acyl carrier protein
MTSMEHHNQERISAEVRSLIADIIERPEEEIQGDISFAELGADSLMALEIVASIEKKYRIQVPEEHLQRVKTFNDVVMLVREHVAT